MFGVLLAGAIGGILGGAINGGNPVMMMSQQEFYDSLPEDEQIKYMLLHKFWDNNVHMNRKNLSIFKRNGNTVTVKVEFPSEDGTSRKYDLIDINWINGRDNDVVKNDPKLIQAIKNLKNFHTRP
jgi:hypothetical protein